MGQGHIHAPSVGPAAPRACSDLHQVHGPNQGHTILAWLHSSSNPLPRLACLLAHLRHPVLPSPCPEEPLHWPNKLTHSTTLCQRKPSLPMLAATHMLCGTCATAVDQCKPLALPLGHTWIALPKLTPFLAGPAGLPKADAPHDEHASLPVFCCLAQAVSRNPPSSDWQCQLDLEDRGERQGSDEGHGFVDTFIFGPPLLPPVWRERAFRSFSKSVLQTPNKHLWTFLRHINGHSTLLDHR